MAAAAVTLNSGASINGDLLVPGTPTLHLNGSGITFGGTIIGSGSSTPSGYAVTLNSSSQLGHLRTRTDPVALPNVSAPPAPSGTRSVSINGASQSPGDFATLKNLTLNSNVGDFTIPAGVYGDFTANGGAGFTLGIAGATSAAVYTFQHFTLNSSAHLNVVGPVVITVANSISLNGSFAGNSAHPEWLNLQISGGGLTLNSSVSLYGYVTAPGGVVTINSQAQLVGGLVADRLTVNSSGTLRLIAPVVNQPPSVTLTSPSNQATFIAPASFPLVATASDPDSSIVKVEFYAGATKLGEATAAPFQWPVTGLPAGTYTFSARAIDSSNAATDSASVTVMVGNNQPPSVALTGPAEGSNFIAPAAFTLAANASDADGSVTRVEFYRGATQLGIVTSAPYQFPVSGLTVGNYAFTARAYDDRNASTDSSPLNISVVSPPNRPPVVTLTAPANGTQFNAPATINLVASASDPDGAVAQVEFFQNSFNLGATAVSPYQFTVANLAAGTYTFTARATDNNNAATDSPPITVSVIGINQPPTVTLTAPVSGSVFNVPATIQLRASASDPDGSIARVEFYQGTIKLGESLQIPYGFTWSGMLPGSYALSAKAYDNQGATALSAASATTVQAALPYVADFESSEGYSVGPLSNYGAWVLSGNILVSSDRSNTGGQALLIPAATPAARFTQTFPVSNNQNVVFVDFFAQPVAAADPTSGNFVHAEGAAVALVRNGQQGEFQVYNGNGTGSGTWQSTGVFVPVNVAGQATSWQRITLREDFQTKKWDLYINGTLKAADCGFLDSAAATFGTLTLLGGTTDSTWVDSLLIGFDNPLFTDADKDGMDDAWELAHGLNPTVNDRNADPDGDGTTNIQEYLSGTDPQHDDRSPTFVTVSIVSGDNQSAFPGQFNSQPLLVAVTNASTNAPMANQAVVFTVTAGGGLIATTNSNTGLTPSLSILTDADGKASVYYQQPAAPQVVSSIAANAGAAQAIFHSASADRGALDTLYQTDFEASEGYTLGSVDAQNGWVVDFGAVAVSSDAHANGAFGLALQPGAQVERTLEGDPQKSVAFIDLRFKPTIETDMFSSSGFNTAEATVIFKQVGDKGEVWAYDGAIGDWVKTDASIQLDSTGAAPWTRFTARVDYKVRVWDLYVDGKLVMADAGFADPSSDHLTVFFAWGSSTTGVAWLDSLSAGYDNPLFVDRDRDGMDDAWEVAHGLDPTVDDSELDPDHDGLTNIQEYRFGTDPHNADTDGNGTRDGAQSGVDSDNNGIPDGWEMLHFGHIGVDPNADPDGDGLSNLQEYQRGTDPNDYYNGRLPVVRSLLGADGRLGPGGLFAMSVMSADGLPLANAPVTFEVEVGASRIALTPGGPPVTGSLTVRSGSDGIARVYVQPAQH